MPSGSIMPDMTDSLIVSAVQWVPEVLDLERGLMRADDAIKEAARNGARLAVFPETWLLGYPYWASLSVRDPRFAVVRRLLQQQAFTRDSQAMQNLQKSAASAGIAIAMGFHESAGGTLFNSVAYIGADGELLNVHRKLMPTNTERLIWGFGDGSDLAPVELDGWKLNGLLCFEHQMALARHALAIDGVDVHAALWPGHAFIDGVIDASTRHIAHENGCFVVVAREIMSVDRLGRHLPDFGDEPARWVGHGGSAIIGPDGTYLSEPVFDVEAIVYAELDLAKIMDAKWLFDGVGHYSRPDVFQLKWDKAPKTPLA